MKKWVFGCLGLFIIVAVGGGYAAYRFLYLPGKAYVQSFTQLKVVPELNAQVTNKASYTPPAGNVLNAATVERFVRAQQAIQTQMGARLQELDLKYKSLAERLQNKDEKPTFGEAMSVLKDVTGLFVDAKHAQVQALNANGFSLAEYEWTRARVYDALGMPMNTTMQQIISDASAGRMPDVKKLQDTTQVQVPEKNRELVKPYTKELTEGAPLAFFAL